MIRHKPPGPFSTNPEIIDYFNKVWNKPIHHFINKQPKITLDRVFLNKLRKKYDQTN